MWDKFSCAAARLAFGVCNGGGADDDCQKRGDKKSARVQRSSLGRRLALLDSVWRARARSANSSAITSSPVTAKTTPTTTTHQLHTHKHTHTEKSARSKKAHATRMRRPRGACSRRRPLEIHYMAEFEVCVARARVERCASWPVILTVIYGFR